MATEDETDLDLLLELLDDIQPECGNREKDDLAKDEQKAFRAKGQEEHEKQKKELELKSLQQDIDERKGYATKIFFLVCVWLATVKCSDRPRVWAFSLSRSSSLCKDAETAFSQFSTETLRAGLLRLAAYRRLRLTDRQKRNRSR